MNHGPDILHWWQQYDQRHDQGRKVSAVGDTVKLILKAIADSSNNKFLIDGFPRNDENREVWDRVVRSASFDPISRSHFSIAFV